jgi:uncharacterized protein YuzE
MAKVNTSQAAINEIFSAMPHLFRLPVKRLWIDYDEEADVLYVSFNRPQDATDSEMSDDGILARYRGKELVGLAFRRNKNPEFNK